MKTRISILFLFLGLFLLTPMAISGTAADVKANNTFSLSYTTTSTSSKLAGYGSINWQVTGYASITGNAYPFDEVDSEYDCEMWLYASGDIDSSPFPSKDNIDTARVENSVNYDVHTEDDASILYKSHAVTRSLKDRRNPLSGVVSRTLSHSLSDSYADSSSSPTDLCASPEAHGNLDGTIRQYVGSKTLVPLSFESETNKACADSLDDGTTVVAVEECFRKGLCKLPGTAKSLYDHRVECEEYVWVREGVVIAGKRFFEKRKPCPVYWWTCDDDPNDPKTMNKCLRTHVDSSELHLEERYVDSNGNPVDPNTEKRPCGHLLSASGDHSLQASCAADSNCISTSFYLCQHTSHEYAPPPPPAMRQCGRHTKAEGGDHRYIRVCAATNANGARCLRTSIGYWACDPHTHVYPEPPPPSPPPPATVSCGRSACTETVSSTNEHRVGPCSACGKSYWSCGRYGSYHENQCRERTCRYGGCGNKWRRCQSSTPYCSNNPDRRCWAS